MTDAQDEHERIMRKVAERLSDTPYVLKGGTALRLVRDLPRHSTDLDFGSGQKVEIRKKIAEGFRDAGVEITSFKVRTNTGTMQRYMVHYTNLANGEDTLLKVETSFRQDPDERDVEIVDGLRTFKPLMLLDQKLAAAENRTEARDLYDLGFLMERYGREATPDQLARVDYLTHDLDGLEVRYQQPFDDDDIVGNLSTAGDSALKLRLELENELARRGVERVADLDRSPPEPEQSPPTPEDPRQAQYRDSDGPER